MKGTSYKLTKKKKIFCLTILFFTAIFILMAIFCFSVYREDQKIVEKEISELEASQKNQKLKPKLNNQTQHLYDTLLPELSANLPTITTFEGSSLESDCHEAVQKFRDIPPVITPFDGISLDYEHDLYVHFCSTSLAYSKILNECLNDQTKQMIKSKNYDMKVLRRLINYMLSKETFGVYINNVLVLQSLLKSLEEKEISNKQSFFVTYEKQLKTLDHALIQIVLFMKSKKEALLRLLEYSNNQDYTDLTKIAEMIEDVKDDEKQEPSIFISFIRTVRVIPVLILEKTLRNFFNILLVNNNDGFTITSKKKYKGTKLLSKIRFFRKTVYRMLNSIVIILSKIFTMNANRTNVEIIYNETEMFELANDISLTGEDFIDSLNFSLKSIVG
eukprot:GAHX01002140.1.p1 GENE.GAHX01002140.1~~GAHX01002140.1.p1  ORF type:complete len:388 (-),score=61.63 GAHX01002140.1:127-1290(-)